MAHWSCRNGHGWEAPSRLSPKFDPARLDCPECGHRAESLKRSAPLRRISEKREGEVRRQVSTLKRGRGFAVTKAQREKVKGLPCVNCGRERSEYVAIDPAHLSKRGSQGGCDHILCVMPLCRDMDGGCHIPFDKGELDIYPALQTKGYWAEMAHAVEAHQVSPSLLVTRLSGGRWELVERKSVLELTEPPKQETPLAVSGRSSR